MATQPRVPGAASTEVDFELERFERTGPDRIEIAGRWFGLRGRRFVRPVLNLRTDGGSRRRAIALLEHKPWAAHDGETWIAAFAWPSGAAGVESAELEVGPGLMVELPAPGAETVANRRVSALRPHAGPPAVRVRDDFDPEPELPPALDRAPAMRDGDGAPAVAPRPRAPSPPRDVVTAARAERDEAITARDEAERERIRALNERDDALSRRDAALRDADRAAEERDEAVAQRERLQAELDRVTHERDVADAERKRMMQETEAVARERDQAAAEREAARAELSRALPEREHALREAELMTSRAEQSESERDTALAERKSAVAQRDRARRERDRAMRAAGVEPPVESPHVGPVRPAPAAPPPFPTAPPAEGEERPGRVPAPGSRPPGTPLPTRPVKVIGTNPAGGTPEPKPLLTPVDSGSPRRLSRTRRTPSAPARWAVRLLVVLVMLAALAALAVLLATVV